MTTYLQPSLHVPPSPAEAKAIGDRMSREVWEAADHAWRLAIRLKVIGMPPGERFIAEDLVLDAAERGFRTRNAKAVGHILKALARTGMIERTGEVRRARTSNGSYKSVWRRL